MVTPPRAGTADGRQAGYNLVILMVLITVLGILATAALPAWSAAMQRQKEEELIFRGLQYAEAIRVFQQRFGRLPNNLEELVKVEPRSIRRLWEDPLTGKAQWGLVFAQQGVPNTTPDGRPAPGGTVVEGARSGDEDRVTQGPITGVYSLADGEPILVFLDQQSYAQWRFTVDLVQQPLDALRQKTRTVVGFVGIQEERVPDLSSRWIGRPWPKELQTQIQQGSAPVQQGSGLERTDGDER